MATRVQSSGVVVIQGTTANPLVINVSLPAPPTVGNYLLFVCKGGPSGIGSVLTVTDNATGGTNTPYTQDVNVDYSTCSKYLLSSGNVKVDRTNSGTFTVTFSRTSDGTAQWMGAAVTEFSVATLALRSTFAQDASCSPPPPNVVDTTALATGGAKEICWAIALIKGNYAGTVTKEASGTAPSSGWTEEVNTSGGANAPPPFSVESYIATSAQAFRHEWDVSTSTNAAWASSISAYTYTDPVAAAVLMDDEAIWYSVVRRW